MNEAHKLWKDHLSAYSSYLTIVGAGRHDDVFECIAKEEKRSAFNIEHPTLSRALFLPMGANNKMLWTDKGINWLMETVIRFAPINESCTVRLLASFRMVDKLADDLKSKVVSALEKMRADVDKSECPWVAGRIDDYLGNSH